MTLILSLHEHAHDPQAAPDVQDVQAQLLRRGYNLGRWGADGDFGSYTDRAVRAYQSKIGLQADGRVGSRTWGALTKQPTSRPTSSTSTAAKFADRVYVRMCGRDGHRRPNYDWGHEVRLSDDYPTAFDCSEASEWGIYQITGHDWRDGSWNQAAGCHLISVSSAMRTKGALMFITDNGHTTGVHHVAVSMGNGYTAEARSESSGCGSWSASGRFNLAGLIPVLKY